MLSLEQKTLRQVFLFKYGAEEPFEVSLLVLDDGPQLHCGVYRLTDNWLGLIPVVELELLLS